MSDAGALEDLFPSLPLECVNKGLSTACLACPQEDVDDCCWTKTAICAHVHIINICELN